MIRPETGARFPFLIRTAVNLWGTIVLGKGVTRRQDKGLVPGTGIKDEA
jgi:hypothetical protein